MTSPPSTVQKAIVAPATHTAAKMAAPATSITPTIATRPGSQSMSRPPSANANTATLWSTRPSFLREKSAVITW